MNLKIVNPDVAKIAATKMVRLITGMPLKDSADTVMQMAFFTVNENFWPLDKIREEFKKEGFNLIINTSFEGYTIEMVADNKHGNKHSEKKPTASAQQNAQAQKQQQRQQSANQHSRNQPTTPNAEARQVKNTPSDNTSRPQRKNEPKHRVEKKPRESGSRKEALSDAHVLLKIVSVRKTTAWLAVIAMVAFEISNNIGYFLLPGFAFFIAFRIRSVGNGSKAYAGHALRGTLAAAIVSRVIFALYQLSFEQYSTDEAMEYLV